MVLSEQELLPQPHGSSLVRVTTMALAINIFFRKSFTFVRHGIAMTFLLAMSHCEKMENKFARWIACSVVLLASWAFVAYKKSLPMDLATMMVKHVDSQDLLNLFITSIFVVASRFLHARWISDPFTTLQVGWACIPLLSLFQLVRKPACVKSFLRPLRVALGPTSILLAMQVGMLQAMTDSCWNNAFHMLMGLGCATLSFLAGFVFRPNNDQLLQHIPLLPQRWIPNSKTRLWLHGRCNCCLVFCCAIPMTISLYLVGGHH